MPLEYEYAFYNFNKNEIISNIKKLKAKLKGIYLFRIQVFIHPLEKEGTYIRVRDEGYKTTLTYKFQKPTDKFAEENEIIINNFDEAVNILLGLGCKKKFYYEKIREIWTIDNSEIVFDTNPGVIDRMEIESKTKKELNKLIKYLNLDIQKFQDKYFELFGIVIPKAVDLTFQNCKKTLLKYVKKNKSDFIDLVDSQIIKYNKLKKNK
jgi:adenylate cyclase class IV